jgi:hypothetical protein
MSYRRTLRLALWTGGALLALNVVLVLVTAPGAPPPPASITAPGAGEQAVAPHGVPTPCDCERVGLSYPC